ncbi:hypothetical protein ACWGRF_23115 [Streptomyces zhihengii]|uniref:Uncharacterized protein n=1 Tax=Streptomyces zhihengii TaxID=1818004 RepID=A0ABS2V4L3_9ACTN|nr:hypothetical protein [Streptomyces zhihengii]
MVKNDDPVREPAVDQPVGDEQCRPAVGQSAKSRQDAMLGTGVERCRRGRPAAT